MRHRQLSSQNFAGRYMYHYASLQYIFPPSFRFIRPAQSCYKNRFVIKHSQSVEMAAVIWREIRNEAGLPDWLKTKIVVDKRKTREPGIHCPKTSVPPGHVVQVNFSAVIS